MASGCDFRLKVKSRRHFLPGLYFLLTLQDFPLVYYSQSSQSNKRFFRFFFGTRGRKFVPHPKRCRGFRQQSLSASSIPNLNDKLVQTALVNRLASFTLAIKELEVENQSDTCRRPPYASSTTRNVSESPYELQRSFKLP